MKTWREILRFEFNRTTRSSRRGRARSRRIKLACEGLEDRRMLAAATLDIGNHVLLPNTPHQWIDIEVLGTLATTGFSFRSQIGDGSTGPAITDFQFDDGDGGENYLWEEHDTIQTGDVPTPNSRGIAQVGVLISGTGLEVTANGLLVSVEVDTTGIDQGTFNFDLKDTLIGADSQFIVTGGSAHDPDITNGSITVIPLFDSPVTTNEDAEITLVPNQIGTVISVDSINTSGPVQATVVDTDNIHYDPSGQFDALALGQQGNSFISISADVDGTTITQTIQVKIDGRNDAPEANDDESATAPGAAVPINVASNDRDVEQNGVLNLQSIRIESLPSHGEVEVFTDSGSAPAVFLYRPSSDFTGTDEFTYTIEDQQGARSLPASVAVVVQPGENPWQNPVDRFDVDGDGRLNPLDVVQLINRINSAGTGELPAPTGQLSPPPFYDVNGDGRLSPIDVLQVINQVNLENGQAEGERIPPPTPPPAPVVPQNRPQPSSRNKSDERSDAALSTEAVDEVLIGWTAIRNDDLSFDF
jgi:hypothetical protein